MTRRVVTTKGITFDGEELKRICIFEENLSKQDIKKMDPYCKIHQVLVYDEHSHAYEYKNA